MLLLLLPLLETFLAQSTSGPSCVSGTIRFDPQRILNIANYPAAQADPNKYDLTLDYGPQSAMFGPDGVTLSVLKNSNSSAAAIGARLSSTQRILYGKITVALKSAAVPGVISTFITMSQVKDEIDWEVVGAESRSAQTNVFYKGIQEYAVHLERIPIPQGVDQQQIYTIDWRSDRLTWLVNNNPVRTIYKENSTSRLTPPGERWFPQTPSQIQLSVWDGGAPTNPNGTISWAGGPIPWGNRMSYSSIYQYIDIQCYDDNNQPVSAWPPNPSAVNISSYTPSTIYVSGDKVPAVRYDGRMPNEKGNSTGEDLPDGSIAYRSNLIWIATFLAILFALV